MTNGTSKPPTTASVCTVLLPTLWAILCNTRNHGI